MDSIYLGGLLQQAAGGAFELSFALVSVNSYQSLLRLDNQLFTDGNPQSSSAPRTVR